MVSPQHSTALKDKYDDARGVDSALSNAGGKRGDGEGTSVKAEEIAPLEDAEHDGALECAQ